MVEDVLYNLEVLLGIKVMNEVIWVVIIVFNFISYGILLIKWFFLFFKFSK